MRALKSGLLGVVAAFVASAASAATIYLDAGSMEKSRQVTIQGLGNVLAPPVQFQATKNGQEFNFIGWCVDVYHHISLKDYAPDLEYVDTNALTTDFGGAPLDAGDVRKVGLLANYGQLLFDDRPTAPGAFTQVKPVRSSYPTGSAGTAAYNAALAAYNAAKAAHTAATNAYNAAVSTRFTRLSAVQGAIWQVVSNRNVTSVNGDAAFDLLVDQLSSDNLTDYLTGVGHVRQGFQLITPVQQFGGRNGRTPLPLTQSFVIAVPEPTTWVMMILGFGMAGAAIRGRRRHAPATL
ncbi:MAG: PEP-CTERM sorting domain-containing protein [Phenylobacterium sp.]|uniref:PEPxxWA-CTERM sorting domain-containing protein n=1 Tax=Phenylobacterium sp. TaxID=1871053 RepID=UPI001A36E3F4|nr:PEPxxWA-CTERM sorting domain-containing protein [Phenylobacterium sp.]MBL8771529.1 PEP-CTERM sorting domain-containing protein [Phenylobacterium sp.]